RRDHRLGVMREILKCEEPAVALTEGPPLTAGEVQFAKRFKVLHDRIGAVVREQPCTLGRVEVLEIARSQWRGAPCATLVRQNNPESLDSVADPPFAFERSRRLTPWPALEKDQQRQVGITLRGVDDLPSKHLNCGTRRFVP